jgi:hypothetical protein
VRLLARERWIGDGISRVPLLAWFREPAIAAGAKGNNGGWQITGRINFLKARGILQHSAIIRRKVCDISIAKALNCDGKEDVKSDMFHTHHVA